VKTRISGSSGRGLIAFFGGKAIGVYRPRSLPHISKGSMTSFVGLTPESEAVGELSHNQEVLGGRFNGVARAETAYGGGE